MKSRSYFAISLITLLSSSVFSAVEPECAAWFSRSKLKLDDPQCPSKCAATVVDLGTFYCTDRCDELCRLPRNCDAYRKAINVSFTDTAPTNWDEATEKTKAWTAIERQIVAGAILTLPPKLVEKTVFKIHRMGVAKLRSNPASTKRNSVALYDVAFKSSTPIARILAHELAHVYWNSLTKKEESDYMIAANWMKPRQNEKPVLGREMTTLTESDSLVSPTEDFANNVEYLLFDPATLKKLTPSLFGWFRTYLGAKFELGGECVAQPAKGN